MEMNGDECLKLSPLNLGEVLGGDINQHVQHLQEDIVSVVHNLLVTATAVEGYFSISRPDELDAQNPNLERAKKS